ncbi:MAG: signal peptidase I [Acidobacteriota bacterium]
MTAPQPSAAPTTGEPQPIEAPSTPSWRQQSSLFWREWLRPLLLIALVMFSFRSAVADWNDVPTGSMKPTILEGDRIFINKVAYDLKFPFTMWMLADWADPAWGDVIVLRSPKDGKRLVKRVTGLPGDLVEIRDGTLYVNGRAADYAPLDPAIASQLSAEQQKIHRFAEETVDGHAHPVMIRKYMSPGAYGPLRVPAGHYFVMGDNRDNSSDSRAFGPIPREVILGQATAVALSVDPSRYYLPRWQRFFRKLP